MLKVDSFIIVATMFCYIYHLIWMVKGFVGKPLHARVLAQMSKCTVTTPLFTYIPFAWFWMEFTWIHLNQVNVGTNVAIGRDLKKKKHPDANNKNGWIIWHYHCMWDVYPSMPRLISFCHLNRISFVQKECKFQLHDICQQRHQVTTQADYLQCTATGLGYQLATNSNQFTSNHWSGLNLSEHTTTASTYHKTRGGQHTGQQIWAPPGYVKMYILLYCKSVL